MTRARQQKSGGSGRGGSGGKLPPLDPQSATRFYDHPIWYDLVHQRGTGWEVEFVRRIAARWVDTGSLAQTDGGGDGDRRG